MPEIIGCERGLIKMDCNSGGRGGGGWNMESSVGGGGSYVALNMSK